MTGLYRFIEAEKTTFGVALLCRLLKVARSSLYAWAEGEAARRRRQEATRSTASGWNASCGSAASPVSRAAGAGL
ncbi:hypothetical protein [Streptomyces sp. CA-256286]|uniref:hypothetical protein n=1 Tax=Streptomyces sp. CA-256286 TaxID=2801033 RepID=UPI001A99E656|nr:hypothetical protein [Streptomyces sp. CA-256286]QTA37004.1 hypothetical protein JHY03_72200 [Streptomyces sp. CA-256286]